MVVQTREKISSKKAISASDDDSTSASALSIARNFMEKLRGKKTTNGAAILTKNPAGMVYL